MSWHDLVLAEHAARHLADKKPDFTFVYLERTDKIGHKFGYMSREYLTAIETADRAVGRIVDELKALDLLDQYTIIIQSDHGGIDYQHTRVIPDVMTVPWIAAGPDIIGSHTIAADVSVLDTAPTLARIIGIPLHPSWEGKVIDEIFK
jgi:arylsulfatase A-like enzyme